MFPVLDGILSLAPIVSGRRHVTQVGLVGRYRPPFGALGGIGDRMAGEEVAAESVARFVDDVARRLEAQVDAEPFGPELSEDTADRAEGSDRRRILVPLDGLGDRRGGAVGIGRQLAGTPGVVGAQVDPVAGMAEIEYDPDLCSLSRILAGGGCDDGDGSGGWGEVVAGVSAALRRWRWEQRPTWVTWVPSTSSLVPERLARRIGAIGNLPVHPAVVRSRPGRPQAELANSTHRCSNVWPAFAVDVDGVPGGSLPPGAVLLVDDIYDSGWTLTVVAHRLREAGAGAVLPFVLTRR